MSNYLPLVKKQYTFEGDEVKVAFKRMTRQQMLVMNPLLPKTEEDDVQTTEDQMKMIDVAINILSENIKSFTGLNTDDGDVIEFTDIVNEAYFMKFLSEIAMDLVSSSMVETKSVKKQIQE